MAVAVAIRKSDPVVSRGSILELGFAVVDLETGETAAPKTWLIKPMGFEANMQMARLASVMDTEAIGPDNKVSLAADVMMRGQEVNTVVKAATEWWDIEVGTPSPSAQIVGFNPEVTRQWVAYWFPELAQRFGKSIDLDSAAWAVGLDSALVPERVADELELVGLVTKAVRRAVRTPV